MSKNIHQDYDVTRQVDKENPNSFAVVPQQRAPRSPRDEDRPLSSEQGPLSEEQAALAETLRWAGPNLAAHYESQGITFPTEEQRQEETALALARQEDQLALAPEVDEADDIAARFRMTEEEVLAMENTTAFSLFEGRIDVLRDTRVREYGDVAYGRDKRKENKLWFDPDSQVIYSARVLYVQCFAVVSMLCSAWPIRIQCCPSDNITL